jgi:hypothetical protein
MSCDGNRHKHFKHVEQATGGTVKADELERVFQAGRNRYDAENGAEQQKNEAQTRMLFADMRGLGLRPPTHSKSGLPKKDAQAGYRAVYEQLQKAGYFNGNGQEKIPRDRVGSISRVAHLVAAG